MTYQDAINWLSNSTTWKGAYPGNYTVGREGTTIRYITMHHIVGSMESCASAWATPGRNGSSHFAVGERGAWQFVDTDNTAWCNGNWNSNLQSISIEHEGDWRNGYRNQGCIDKSAELIAYLRIIHPTIQGFQRHNQVSLTGTACPCDLPCEEIWNKSNDIINGWNAPAPVPTPPPTPPPAKIEVTDIINKTLVCNKDANLWDLGFASWDAARAVKTLPSGTNIEVSAIAKHPLGGMYYLTEYSFRQGIMNGINVADLSEVAVTPPPVVEPPITPPVTPPVVTPPIVVPPVTPAPPTEHDKTQDAQISAMQKTLDALTAAVNKIIAWITSWGK